MTPGQKRRRRVQNAMRKHPFVVFVRKLPCAVDPTGHQTTPTEFDHYPTIGAAGLHTHGWPLCTEHHVERHAIGVPAFEAKYGVSIQANVGFLEEWFARLSTGQIAQVTGLRVAVVERRLSGAVAA